jgi:hypothetical protein
MWPFFGQIRVKISAPDKYICRQQLSQKVEINISVPVVSLDRVSGEGFGQK